MSRLDDLLTLERAGQLPPELQRDLDTLRKAGAIPGQPAPSSGAGWSARPFAQAAGAMAGGIGGTMLGGPVGGVVGAGTMGPAAGQLYDAAKEAWRGNVVGPATGEQLLGEAKQVGSDALTSAEGEMGGQVLGKAAQTGASALRSRAAAQPGAAEARTATQAAARAGIPLRASEKTGSTAVRRVENAPGYFAIGTGPLQRMKATQGEAVEGAVRNVVDSVSQSQADALTAGLAAQGGTKRVVAHWRAEKAALFNNVEALAGPEPVVPTTRLRAMAQSIVERTAPTPMGAPGVAVDILEEFTGVPLATLQAEKIPFAVARQIETELGARAFNKSAPVGSMRQGEMAALWRASHDDLDEFLTSPSGTDVAPALAEAKQLYGTGKALFNDAAKRLVLGGKQGLAPDQVVKRAFRPGAVSDTLDYKLLVDDDTYAQSVQAWLRGLQEQATSSGQFSPAKFATALGKYEKNGHLDVIAEPALAAQLRDVRTSIDAMTKMSRGPGENPSGTAQGIWGTGQLQTLGGAGLAAFNGYPRVGASMAAGALAPALAGPLTMSRAGQSALTTLGSEGVTPTLLDILGPNTMRAVTQGLAQR